MSYLTFELTWSCQYSTELEQAGQGRIGDVMSERLLQNG